MLCFLGCSIDIPVEWHSADRGETGTWSKCAIHYITALCHLQPPMRWVAWRDANGRGARAQSIACIKRLYALWRKMHYLDQGMPEFRLYPCVAMANVHALLWGVSLDSSRAFVRPTILVYFPTLLIAA